MMTYQEAKEYLKNKGLKTPKDYEQYWQEHKEENKRIGLPELPEQYYKNHY